MADKTYEVRRTGENSFTIVESVGGCASGIVGCLLILLFGGAIIGDGWLGEWIKEGIALMFEIIFTLLECAFYILRIPLLILLVVGVIALIVYFIKRNK